MEILISAGEGLSGYEIKEYKNIVFGVSNSSVDGENYRQIAMERASKSAEELGANAIVNLRIEIFATNAGVYEATVYGNAVILKSLHQEKPTEAPKVNLEAYTPRPKIEGTFMGELAQINGQEFVVCPKCKSKYKANINENGEFSISGFDDVDDIEPGLQIYCLKCGTKFTVPNSAE